MNRTRASSVDAFGTRNQRNRIYPALEASDGSTLSLDFTQMSSLDSRFTFSSSSTPAVQASTATYINSQGLVQYADHNLFTNTAWLGSTLPTNWNLLIGSGTITWNANGSVTMTAATNQRPAIYHSTITSINPGMPHTFGYLATGVSGSPTISQIINSTIAGEIYAINGVTVASSTVVQSNDVVSCTFTPSTNNVTPRIGPGVTSALSNISVTASRPQFNVGSSLQPYAANTSTTARYQAPRFDYSPTTLTPRGLLIEGTATNLATRSDDFNTSFSDGSQWSPSNYTSGILSTTLPDGTTGDARRISIASGAGSFRSQAITVTANTAYTWSFWARNNGGSQARYRVWNVNGSANIVDYTLSGSNYVSSIGGAGNTSSTWVRVSVPFTTPIGCTSVFVYPSSSDSGSVDLLVWGAQLEAGTGASSYIPTATAAVTRAADKLTMSNIALMQWNQTAGTFLWDMDVQAETNTSSFPAFAGMYRAGPVRVIRFQLNNSSGTTPRIGGGTWTATPSSIVTDSLYTRPVGTPFKAAVAFANTGQSMTYCINGTVQTTVTGTGTLATPTLFLMHQDPSAADTEYFPIHLRRLKYWPTNLSSSDLSSITT